MNFVKVDSLVIPDGEVYRIIDNNNILWQKKKTFRYLKLVMDEIADSSTRTIVQFSEIEFLDEDGILFDFPDNTIVTATIESSSGSTSDSEPEIPNNLIDGTTLTKFCSQKWIAGSYVLFDLGENEKINVLRYNTWRWYTANDTSEFPERNLKTFSLYGSKNGSTWELLDSVENYDATTENYALAYTGMIVID